MIDISWDSTITKDPLKLADAIELTVAFGDDYAIPFNRAKFQTLVSTENLSDDGGNYLSGDQIDALVDKFEQAVSLICNRALWLGQMYPFSVVAGEVLFTPQVGERRHLPYLFLLVCSNGNCVPELKRALPDRFEDLCKDALGSLFPDWAEILSFSQKSEDRKTIFGWEANVAVPVLAQKLNTDPINLKRLPNTQREFGIDIIAICGFGDQSAYPFFAFAQCTVAQEWWHKRHEAIADSSLTEFVQLSARHSNFLMIPHFPRFKLDEWSEDPGLTGNCILCDRFRICTLLEKSNSFDHDNPPASVSEIFETLEENLMRVPNGV